MQSIAPALAAEGVALYALSYDPVATLAAFAEHHGITYPLLSDEGSRELARLGLRDDHLEAHQAAYGLTVKAHMAGVAYPGVFVLDREGVVADKRFSESYRERETGLTLLEEALGIAAPTHGPSVAVPGEVVDVQARVDTPTWWWWQRLRLLIDLRIRPGWHVYGEGSPPAYVPLGVELEEARGISVGAPTLEPPRLADVAGETVPVHEGEVRIVVPVTVRRPPESGDVVLRGRVRFQACGTTECLPPVEAAITLTIPEADPATAAPAP